MRFFHTLLAVISFLEISLSTSAVVALSCGAVDSAFTTADGTSTSLTLSKSNADALCMLFRVTPIGSANINDISPDSNLSDYNMVPVARSYQGNDWQRVAGTYAQDLSISCSTECTLTIPPKFFAPGIFVLMPFIHDLPTNAKISRFFHQTTFGPNLSMINNWDSSTDLDTAMKNWVEDQMNSTITPITSHRQFFRDRVNGELEYAEERERLGTSSTKQMYKVRNPCDAGARWVKYTFTTDDYGFMFEVTNHTDGTKLLTDPYGVARTYLKSFKREGGDGTDLPEGSYRVNGRVDEYLGGRVLMSSYVDPNAPFSFYLEGGNPIVNLPNPTDNVTFVDLPQESDFLTTDTITYGRYYYIRHGETMYLDSDLTLSICTNFNYGDTKNIVGTLQGCVPDSTTNCQVRYGRYVAFENNVESSPLLDGGSDLEMCSNVAMNFKNENNCKLSVDACDTTALVYSREVLPQGSATVVCGSVGEVANNPIGEPIFHLAHTTDLKSDFYTGKQKENVWNMIAVSSDTGDQLRQRVAWALNQLLVITPNQIARPEFSEIYLNYYDIFIRNAFGNYFDILKEVSYSPMMGEMLSFIGSRSYPYILEATGISVFPDENYAREVMQLFSIGIYKLNIDGTLDLDSNGVPQLTYSNEDIQNFARAWTGFDNTNTYHSTSDYSRSNTEQYYWDGDRIDPMMIWGPHRDFSPKADLYGGYIGDRYPLCTDLPAQHFLKIGATYKLLGSSKWPLLHTADRGWFNNANYNIVVTNVTTGELYDKLCTDSGSGCDFAPVVTLDTNLNCVSGNPECKVDDLRIIKVSDNPLVHYEYVRVPCVEHSFYENSKTVQHMSEAEGAMCANADLALAGDACCSNPTVSNPSGRMSCEYTAEKVKFSTSEARCSANYPDSGEQCPWRWEQVNDNPGRFCNLNYEENFYWGSPDLCRLQAKITTDGTIAVVHHPVINPAYSVDINAGVSNRNYFKVDWNTDFPLEVAGSCGNMECTVYGQDCLCNVTISDSVVFTDMPTRDQILANLKIGAIDPVMKPGPAGYELLVSSADVEVYEYVNGGYDMNTIFKIIYLGETLFLKNMRSNVNIAGSGLSFRNPVQFLNPALRETRDAQYETDAVLKHYFQHPNMAPFLALRMIQRFGTSNPSPAYIKEVAEAFISGSYMTFGDGHYGNLEAFFAAIILHEEPRNVLLDADPTSGSLREPLLKVIAFMRAMEFNIQADSPELQLNDLQSRIGQMVHNIPNVFSFFLPEYQAPGHVESATLVSPEAQAMNGPAIISHINGHFSLTDLGLNDCYGGFGEQMTHTTGCRYLRDRINGYAPESYSKGILGYAPSSTNAGEIIDELDLLLVAGKLSAGNKAELVNMYDGYGLSAVQKLMTTTPEFHSTGVFSDTSTARPIPGTPSPSPEPYKAIVFYNLAGGADTMNLLIPDQSCSMYSNYTAVRTSIALNGSLTLPIDATGSGQVCDTFALHPNLPVLKDMYDSSELTFFTNIGVLQGYATKANWRTVHDDTSLFAHNSQQSEVQNMDIFEEQAGRGVGGRILDVLKAKGFKTSAVSTRGVKEVLASADTPLIVVPSISQYQKVDPMSAGQTDENLYIDKIRLLNKKAKVGSNLLTESYSSLVHEAISENNLLYQALQDVTLATDFGSESTARQFDTISRMMKTKQTRGADRDIYYVEQTGFDNHNNLLSSFNTLMERMNHALSKFREEMIAQGIWDQITVVVTTEFARTLTTNSGVGSDHAWGGNLFMCGGGVDGKKILGSYPDDLSVDGYLSTNARGILIPTTPWESVWNGVAQWFGVTNPNDLDIVLPNRHTFTDVNSNALFTSETLYGFATTSSPSLSSVPSAVTPSPSAVPGSAQPSKTPTVNPYIDIEWNANSVYEDRTVLIGETVRFLWSGNHNVYINLDGSCTSSNQVGSATGTTYNFNTAGSFTFICLVGTHCSSSGQKITFHVVSSMHPSSAPSVSMQPSKTPTVSPVASVDCSQYTKSNHCNNAGGCSWTGGKNAECISVNPTTPAPADPTPAPAPSTCSSTNCGGCGGGGECKKAGCNWNKGLCS